MAGVYKWFRYMAAKHEHAVSVARKLQSDRPKKNKLKRSEVYDIIWKNMLNERLTFLHWSKEEQMPMLGTKGGVLLVRKLPEMNPTTLRVGDVVVHKDPKNLGNLLVRRIAAVEGWEYVSTDEKVRSYILVKNQCWVFADNKTLNYERAYDSRSFGPLYVPHILGRAIYCLRSAEDHGPIKNSPHSIRKDSAVIGGELDIDEMIKNHKA